MAGTATPIFAQTPQTKGALLQNSTGALTFSPTATTNMVSLYAGGTNGSIVNAITVTTTDTSAETLILSLWNGTNNFLLGEFNIPLTSGFTTTAPPVDLFRNSQSPAVPIDVNGNRYIYVPNGWTLYVGTTAVVTTAKYTMVVAVGEDF